MKTINAPVAEMPLPMQASASRYDREQRQFWRGILVGGGSFGVFLLLLGFVFSNSLGWKLNTQKPSADNFVEAVRLAEQASIDGKKAQSPADWLKLAAKWQQASELMTSVPSSDPRYKTARERSVYYRKNSEATQLKAEKIRAEPKEGK